MNTIRALGAGAAIAALLAGSAAAAPSGFTVNRGANDSLVATMSVPDGTVAFRYDASCETGNPVPCYTFVAVNGTEAVTVGAGAQCQAGAESQSSVTCPAQGVRSVEIVFENGGTIGTGVGNGGEHVGECAPVPVSIRAHAGDSTFNVGVWDGCHESVYCYGAGMVDADKGDDLHDCDFVTRH